MLLEKAKVLAIQLVSRDVTIPTDISLGLYLKQRLDCTVSPIWTVNRLETFQFLIIIL